MKIEVLGPGCYRCAAAQQHVHEALQEAGVEAEVVHIDDYREIARRRVMFTPAVFIDGELKAKGRIPKVSEIVTWLESAVQEDRGAA